MRVRNQAATAMVVAIAGFFCLSDLVRAEEFLGVESADTPNDTKVPDAAEQKMEKRPIRSEPSSNDNSPAGDDEGRFSFSAAFAAGANVLGGQATVGYSWNRYIGVDTTYQYFQQNGDHDDGVAYGPDVAGVLRLPNPTIVTPFVGAGPGYTKWQRRHDDAEFDSGSSWIFNTFGGINIGLTRHFGLQVARRQTQYLQRPPIMYADRKTEEEPTRIGTNVGFYMAF